MPTLDAVAIVEAFWAEVWQSPQNPDAVDDFVTEDFIITSGGVDIVSRAAFKAWVIGFQQTINGLEFDLIESFQNADGSRVASRFRIRRPQQRLPRHHARSASHHLHRHRSLGRTRRRQTAPQLGRAKCLGGLPEPDDRHPALNGATSARLA